MFVNMLNSSKIAAKFAYRTSSAFEKAAAVQSAPSDQRGNLGHALKTACEIPIKDLD